jgi:hypothetical protein
MINTATKSESRPEPVKRLVINERCILLPLSFVRVARGWDADTVRRVVVNSVHPKCLRWVFDLSTKSGGRRELRFWKKEILGDANRWDNPDAVIGQILGNRQFHIRGGLEVAWTIDSPTVTRLINCGEIEAEVIQAELFG